MTCRAFKRASPAYRAIDFPQFSLDGARLYLPDGPWDWAGVDPEFKDRLTFDFNESPTQEEVRLPGGTFLLKRRGAGVVEAFEVSTGKLTQRLVAFPPSINLVAFGFPRNLVLACSPMSDPWIWNRTVPPTPVPAMLDGELQAPAYSVLAHSPSRAIAWSGNGKWIAVGTLKGEIHLYDATVIPAPIGPPAARLGTVNPVRKLLGLEASIRSIAFFRGGLVALDERGMAARWFLDAGTPDAKWQANQGRGNAIQVAKDGSWALTGGLDGISLWTLPDCNSTRHFGGSHFGVVDLHLEPNQGWVAATFLNGMVATFDLPTGRERWKAEHGSGVASAVAIHPSGSWLVSAGWQSELIAWDASTGRERKRIHGPALSLAWSQDGKRLAAGHAAGVSIYTEDLSHTKDPAYELNYGWNEECT